MAWNYSGDPSASDLDQVRFLVGDTDSTDELLQDEEINWLLTEYPTVYVAAAEAAKAIASKFARLADTNIEGAVSVKYSQRQKQFLQLAVRLEEKADSGGGIAAPFVSGVSQGEMEAVRQDEDRVPSRFYRGKFDYPPKGDEDVEWY